MAAGRTLVLAAALFCAVGACHRDKPSAAGSGPVDPIPGPAGAVSPLGNDVPGGAPASAKPTPPPGNAGNTSTAAGNNAAEAKMPQSGGGGKSVQEAASQGASQNEPGGAKK